MEQMIVLIEKSEFKHIIEFEINRLDIVIGSLQSNLTQISFAFIGSLFAVMLSLGVFIKNMSNLIDIFITISFFIASVLFVYSNFSYIKALVLPKVSAKPIVKNVSYNVVLKINMEDRKTYLKNFFEPILKINLSMQILFIISMVSPFILQSLSLSVWDKSIQWISYFIVFDFILLLFFHRFYNDKTYTDVLFDRDRIVSVFKKVKSIKKYNLNILVLSLFIIVYPYFWFILTSQYILLNINYLFLKFNELPFVYLVVLITTWFFIKLENEYINCKYHTQVLVLKQEKYRDIRRELYESNNPDIENLWKEFKLNAPW